ncbi:MAG: HAMP domain-containing protein [Rhodospirillales bacterium]|nr:HAMP domain-containing protein [Rhodospirillales bacterium]
MGVRLPFNRTLKRILPRSLLGRSLLMILVPLVLLQAVALQIYYGSHLNLVYRRLSDSLAGEINFTLALIEQAPDPAARAQIVAQAERQFGVTLHWEPGAELRHTGARVNVLGPMDDDLENALRQTLRDRFNMDWTYDRSAVLIRVALPDGVMNILTPRKRVDLGTIWLFVGWLVGTSALLFGIAALFMRNQVRGIRRLADAVEAFGIGRDPGPIRPEGAVEVRRAATAFNRMAERIRRFLSQRTEMLAGVSHDLRTPLTRMRLALAMLPAHPEQATDVAEITADVAEMERMIEAYLAFARGEGAEQAEPTDLVTLLQEVGADARRAGAHVDLDLPPSLPMRLRADAVRRALTNLIDNARRHARRIVLAAAPMGGRSVLVTVDDDGPGIPPDRRESVFRPFESDTSGGTGLGLTIARDIIRAHGGEIVLEESPLGGLRARIRLPV